MSTKIHLAVRGLGCPVAVHLTGGHEGDVPQAGALIEGHRAEVVLADAAYDPDHLRALIAAMAARAVIPNNSRRAAKHAFDRHLHREPPLIECCFAKLKHLRRVATRHDRRAPHFAGFVHLAAAMIWIT